MFVPAAAAHFAHHDEAGMDADSYRQGHTPSLGEAAIRRPHGLQDSQPTLYRALGIVLMRLRIAEVDEQAIPQVLGDMPAEALDNGHAGGLISPNHLAQILRIKLSGETSGIGEVAEHHRELSSLGVCCGSSRYQRVGAVSRETCCVL